MTTFGGIILCGGKSTRMGMDKASLPFGDETMLARVARLLGEVVSPLVVVAARDQPLPPIAVAHRIERDQRESRGPLEGLAAGLAALEGAVDAAYVTSCDVPLLVPAFVRHLTELLEDFDIVVPQEEKFHHPLAAVYRTSVLATVNSLLAEDRLRPRFLFDECRTREVAVDDLRTIDPELSTLANLNAREDYLAALQEAGIPMSEEVRRHWG